MQKVDLGIPVVVVSMVSVSFCIVSSLWGSVSPIKTEKKIQANQAFKKNVFNDDGSVECDVDSLRCLLSDNVRHSNEQEN